MSKCLALHQLVTEHVWQGHQRPSRRSIVCVKGTAGSKLFSSCLFNDNFPVSVLYDSRFLWLVPRNSRLKANVWYEMSLPIAVELQPYFQTIVLMSGEADHKWLKIIQNVLNNLPASTVARFAPKDWNVLIMSCLLGSRRLVIEPGRWFCSACAPRFGTITTIGLRCVTEAEINACRRPSTAVGSRWRENNGNTTVARS